MASPQDNINGSVPQQCEIIVKMPNEKYLAFTIWKQCDNTEDNNTLRLVSRSINPLETIYLFKNTSQIITSLDASYCALTATPKHLKLPYLKQLNLSHNRLTTIPACLYYGLNFLESLDLSYNEISNFDLEPNCIATLQTLKLDNNKFDKFPSWFLNFRSKNLRELSYCDNKSTTFKFLDHICNFFTMKLEKLELKNACLINIDFNWIKLIKNLNYLDISNKSLEFDKKYINKFEDLDKLFQKPCWTDMQVLKLNFLDLGLFPEGLFWMESLKELHITNNSLTWFPEEGIEYLVNLEFLDVSCNILVALPEKICELMSLKTIIAYTNHIEFIPSLPKSLECLDLYDNLLDDFDSDLISEIDLVDFDYNYVDVNEERFDYKQYSEKRCELRLKFQYQDRGKDCIKIVEIKPDYEREVEDYEDGGSNNIEIIDDWDEGNDSEKAIWDWVESWDYDNKEVKYHVYIDVEEYLYADAD